MKSHLLYSRLVSVAALTGLALGGVAWAQTAPGVGGPQAGPAADGDAAPEARSDVIIVTGTRQSGLEAADSPAPITVVGAEILEHSARPDLFQALAQNVPSFNAQAFGGELGNLTLSGKLRGLSPNHALVLVNGKRRHGGASLAISAGPYQGGAAADLNFIPVASIDHIEVLQDGAAAQYGSDAIAGVINIIQKKDDHGGQVNLSGGEYFDGGGRTGDVTANLGTAPDDRSFLNITLEAKYHDFSFRGDVDPRTTNTPYNVGSASSLAANPGLVNVPGYPYLNRIAGDAEYRLYTGAYNFGYELSPDWDIYSFGTYGYKFGQSNENYRLPNLVIGKDGSVPRAQGFTPKETITENDYATTFGTRARIIGWNADLSTTYGSDNQSVNTLNSINRSLYIDTSTATTPGFSPTDFHVGDFLGSQWTTNLDLTHDYNVGLASPLTVAAGVEYRKDTYQIKPGDAASRYKEGSQSYPGFSLTDAGKHDRDSKAVYIDLAVKPVDALQLDGAVRYETFSDFGDTTVFKLTSRYDFSHAFALRGTASTGFRAPTLAEEYYSATNVSPTAAFVQLPPNAPAAQLIGIDGLKPEKSTNFSVGFVAHPISRFDITLDAYQIKIEDRIVGSGQLFGTGGAINSLAVRNAIIANGNLLDTTVTQTGISIFSNGLDTRTQGIDFVATYASDFGAIGDIDWSLTANYNDTKVTRIAPAPSQLAAGVALFDKSAISYLETASPKYRLSAGALWKLGKFTVNLHEALFGPSSIYQTRTGGIYYQTKIDAAFITDLDISYQVLERVRISVGANNLFNKYPDKVNAAARQDYLAANSTGYVTQYANFSPFGIDGGYYYGKLTYTF